METARTRALKSLATSMPVANQQVAQGLQQARLLGVQRAVASAPPATSLREVQQAGAAQVTAQAGIQQKAAEQTQSALGQVAQLGQAEQARANAEQLGQSRVAASQKARQNETELAGLGRDLKQRIFDSRTQFARDEQGRAVMNEYQLADWAVSKSKNAEGAKARMQEMQLAHERRMEMLRVAETRLTQAMEFEQKKSAQDRDNTTYERLARAKAAVAEKVRLEQADAANKQAMWQTGGTIVGAVAGLVVTGGNPAGAAAGAALGGAAGSYAGSQMNK